MNSDDAPKTKPKLLWPGRPAAIRRLLFIALVLFPCTWIITAILIGNWDLLDNRSPEAYRHVCEAFTTFVGAVAVVFLISLLPSFRRFFEWLFSRRIIRRTLIASAWIVTLAALFYGEQDWRGRRRWENYSESLKAQGEELGFKAYVPKPVPDAENFAATPEIQSWFIGTTNGTKVEFTNHWTSDDFARAAEMVRGDTDKMPRQITDLVAWQIAFEAVRTGHTNGDERFNSDKLDPESRSNAAVAVLAALNPIDGRLEELRSASGRPECVYPVVYTLDDPWGIMLPHLANIRAVCQRLDLRACAELAAGQSDRALYDVELSLRMADSLREEPFLISYLVRLAAFHVAVHPIWEGLAEHRWSDAQLQELQRLMAQHHFIADMKPAFDGERAAGILTADLLASGKFHLNELAGDPSKLGANGVNVIGRVIPRGWFEMEKLNYCRLYGVQMDGAFDGAQSRVFPQRIKSHSAALDRAFAGHNPFTTIFTRHQLLAVIMTPALAKIPMKGALAQVTADQAVLACALERYRLAHGQFPDKLEALTPDLIAKLPQDVITGAQYKYRLPASLSSPFVLYSIGWNEKDDGGQVVLKGQVMDPNQGDWLWTYPER